MSDNQDKIDELLKKLDLLLKQQEVFSKEVNAIKTEINAISPISPSKSDSKEEVAEVQIQKPVAPVEDSVAPEEIVVKVFPKSGHKINWLSQNPIDNIQDKGITVQMKMTSKRTEYASFDVAYEGTTYEMCLVSRGKWYLRNEKGELLLHGLFKNGGKSLLISKGKTYNNL